MKKKWKTYSGRVGTLSGALNFSAQSKIGNFTDELRVDENIASGQITMDIVDFREILHAVGDAAQHAQQLKDLELSVVGLNWKKKHIWNWFSHLLFDLRMSFVFVTLRKVSSDPFSMYSVMIMTGLDLVTTPCR